MKLQVQAEVATLVAVADRNPGIRKGELQERLGLSDYRMGRAVAYARLYGLIEIHGGAVTVTATSREILDADTPSS